MCQGEAHTGLLHRRCPGRAGLASCSRVRFTARRAWWTRSRSRQPRPPEAEGHPATIWKPLSGLARRRPPGPAGLAHCSRVRSTARRAWWTRSRSRQPRRRRPKAIRLQYGSPYRGWRGADPQARRALHLVAGSVLRPGGRGGPGAALANHARRRPKAIRLQYGSPYRGWRGADPQARRALHIVAGSVPRPGGRGGPGAALANHARRRPKAIRLQYGSPYRGWRGADPQARRALHIVAGSVSRPGGRGGPGAALANHARRRPKAIRLQYGSPYRGWRGADPQARRALHIVAGSVPRPGGRGGPGAALANHAAGGRRPSGYNMEAPIGAGAAPTPRPGGPCML